MNSSNSAQAADANDAVGRVDVTRHSEEFYAFLSQLRARSSSTNEPTVQESRDSFEAFASSIADPPPVDRESVDIDGVRGEWARPRGGAERLDACIMWVHGGGFVIGAIESYRDLAARVAVGTGCSVLTFDYRLAPEHLFPAALEDTARVLHHLSTVVAPERLVVAGDSVGGGLALGAAIECRDKHGVIPQGIALVSPKVDLAQTGRSITANEDVDPTITAASTTANAARYLGGTGDPFDPKASPLFADLAGLPATYVQVGTAEVLLDDSLRLARRLRDAGVRTDLDVWPDMVHILPFFATRFPEARAAVDSLCKAILSSLRSTSESDTSIQ